MKNTIITIVIVLVVGLGIYYIASNNKSGVAPVDTSTSTTPPVSNDQKADTNSVSKTAFPSNETISIKNFLFYPGTLNIKTGTKVTWVNNDSVSHTVTTDSGNLFNKTLTPGQSFSFTFTSLGSVTYHCKIHPTMKGIIIIHS